MYCFKDFPLQQHWRAFVGHVVYGFLPIDEPQCFLPYVHALFRVDPNATRGTIVVPRRTHEAWYQKFVDRPSSVFRTLTVLESGSSEFEYRESAASTV